MKERSRFQRRLYRYSLRKLKRSTGAADRQLLQLALIDPAIFTMAYEQTMEDLATQPTACSGFAVSRASDGTPIVDNLLKLLDWFVQNGPALIEIIKVIAGLFGGIAVASAILREEFEESGEPFPGDQD